MSQPASSDRARRNMVYVSGPPGAGKSTLMAHLTRYCGRTPITGTIPHDLLTLPTGNSLPPPSFNTAVELGRRREKFSGTDALSMSIQPKAVQYMARPGLAHTLVLAEGDRLANINFLDHCRDLGWAVTLVNLYAPGTLLDERCAARGSTQNEGWRQGRITKAANLARLTANLRHPVIGLDARNSVGCLTRTLVEQLPLLAALFPPDAPERAQ